MGNNIKPKQMILVAIIVGAFAVVGVTVYFLSTKTNIFGNRSDAAAAQQAGAAGAQ
jgi:hypothetical protein